MKRSLLAVLICVVCGIVVSSFCACNVANIFPTYKVMSSAHQSISLDRGEADEPYVLNFDNFNLSAGTLYINFLNDRPLAATVDLSSDFVENGVSISRVRNVLNIRGKSNFYYETDAITVNVYVPVSKISFKGFITVVSNMNNMNNHFVDKLTFHASGAVNFTASNIKVNSLTAKISGASSLFLNLVAVSANFDISGASKCTLTGTVDLTTLNASGATNIEAYDCEVRLLDIIANGNITANVNVSEILSAKLSGACRVNYHGTPRLEKTLTGISAVVQS